MAGSINLDKLDATPEVKTLIRTWPRATRARSTAARGTRSWEQTEKRAAALLRDGIITPETLKG
jgi:hypothetical protein